MIFLETPKLDMNEWKDIVLEKIPPHLWDRFHQYVYTSLFDQNWNRICRILEIDLCYQSTWIDDSFVLYYKIMENGRIFVDYFEWLSIPYRLIDQLQADTYLRAGSIGWLYWKASPTEVEKDVALAYSGLIAQSMKVVNAYERFLIRSKDFMKSPVLKDYIAEFKVAERRLNKMIERLLATKGKTLEEAIEEYRETLQYHRAVDAKDPLYDFDPVKNQQTYQSILKALEVSH